MPEYNAMTFVIPCLLGLEKIIADELEELEAENIICENGRVLFDGDEHILARANICCRCAERVQILVGSFEGFFNQFDAFFRPRLSGNNQKGGRRTA